MSEDLVTPSAVVCPGGAQTSVPCSPGGQGQAPACFCYSGSQWQPLELALR